MALSPEEALKELLENYRDAAAKLERNDRYYRAEPNSVMVGPKVPPALVRFATPWPAARIATHAYADRISVQDVRYSKKSAQTALDAIRDPLLVATKSAMLESLAVGIGYIRSVVLGDGTITFAATRGRDGAFVEDPDTGEILATLRVHRPKRIIGPISNPTTVTVYVPGSATLYTQVPGGKGKNWVVKEIVTFADDILLMRPLVNRQRAGEPYGRAEARDLYAFQDQGSRTLTDLSIAVDSLAVPQKVLIASNPESFTDISMIQTYLDSVLPLKGDGVRIDQWQAAQLAPFIETMNGLSRQAAAVSGIPLSYWGVASDANNVSADSIRENDARLEIRSREIGRQWRPTIHDVAEDAAALLSLDPGVIEVEMSDPANPTPAAAADAMLKLAQVNLPEGPILDRTYVWDQLGTDPETRRRIQDSGVAQRVNDILFGSQSAANPGVNPAQPGAQPSGGTNPPGSQPATG